jgi:hypothetical protein
MLTWLKKCAPTLGRALRVPLSERLSKLSDALEVGGIGCLVGATYMWSDIAGTFALGVALIYLGVVTHVSS